MADIGDTIMKFLGWIFLLAIASALVQSFTGQSYMAAAGVFAVSAVLTWQIKKSSGSNIWTAVFFIVTFAINVIAWYYAPGGQKFVVSLDEEKVANTIVSKATNFPEASGFIFTDAHVETSYQAEIRTKIYYQQLPGTGLTEINIAAPVVSSTWTKEKPVTVWAVYRANGEYDAYRHATTKWKENIRSGVVVTGSFQRERSIKAINRAVKTFSLKTVAKPVLIEWKHINIRKSSR